MRQISCGRFLAIIVATLSLVFSQTVVAQSTLDCKLCHRSATPPLNQWTQWETSPHSNTQNDIAGELAANWSGQLPDSVIHGSQAENCVACHSPVAVSALGGMTEVQVMSHFFSTTNSVYTDSTRAVDTTNWPHVACVTCHNVPPGHPTTAPTLSMFNSATAHYDSVVNASALCGQCHGTLRFADTDHRAYDAWRLSKHGHANQDDLVSELAVSWAGASPDSVISEENCIACHAPTAVKMNGGITEAQALSHFFTTSGGVLTGSTTVADTLHWPDLACNTCHNPHSPRDHSYFNSTTRTYQVMSSTEQICGQCHGNLRFPDTDHLSYNIEQGTGGIGVSDRLTMPGVQCVDCHMHKGDVDGTNSLMYSGHRWQVFIQEPDMSISASCTSCHTSMNADSAKVVVDRWKTDYATQDSIAQSKVAAADSFMQQHTDTLKLRYLDEAKHNLAYAESDESNGFHNHKYLMALLDDAITKAEFIVTGVQETASELPVRFELQQNYPNPFNPTTTISFGLPKELLVTLKVYNLLGQEVATLFNGKQNAGNHVVEFYPGNLSSGVYLYRLQAGDFTDTKKLLLLR